jgi:hypothetical protein
MSNQLVPYSELERMASSLAKSGLFGIKNPDQAVALMLVAQSEGRHPASVAAEFDIIQARPALKSQAALARFQSSGGKIQWVKRTEEECAAEFTHPAGGTLTVSWTWKRAVDAGLTGKQTWKQYPIQMLSARVVAEGVRAVFPACLNGVYLAEEVQDFDSRPAMQRIKTVEPEKVTLIEDKPVVVAKKVNPAELEYPEGPSPADAVFALMDQDKISEAQVLAFLNDKGANKGNAEYVADLAPAVLNRLTKAWDKVVAHAVAASMKEAA